MCTTHCINADRAMWNPICRVNYQCFPSWRIVIISSLPSGEFVWIANWKVRIGVYLKEILYWLTLVALYSAPGGGGHSHWKGVWGCAAVMTPFFQASCRSLAHQFTLNAPLLCPLFSIFRKFLHFQTCFGQNSSSLDPNFLKFSFPRPPFFQENPLPRPYILKPAWHTPTKKKLSAPPPPRIQLCLVRLSLCYRFNR